MAGVQKTLGIVALDVLLAMVICAILGSLGGFSFLGIPITGIFGWIASSAAFGPTQTTKDHWGGIVLNCIPAILGWLLITYSG
jgi:hypothetical protein